MIEAAAAGTIDVVPTSARLWLATTVGLLAWGMPSGDAHADGHTCDPCDSFGGVLAATEVVTALPVDGVLVFELTRPPDTTLGMEELLPFVHIDATDGRGLEVPGETSGAHERVAWRPSMPLTADDVLTINLRVENAAVATLQELDFCMTEDIDISVAAVVVDEEVAAVEDLSGTVTIERVRVPKPAASLDQLVCCDGAQPTLTLDECANATPTWEVGHCESLFARRRLGIDAELQWPDVASNIGTAGYVPVLTFQGDTIDIGTVAQESLGGLGSSAGCASLIVWDFVQQGPHVLDDTCIDAVGAGILGTTARDPSDALADSCSEDPYTCAIVDDRWDDNDCTPWDGVVPPQRQPGTDSGGSESGGDESDSGSSDDDGNDDFDDNDDNDDNDDDDDNDSSGPSNGCNSPDEHDHSDDRATGCAYCGTGSRRPPWLVMLLLLAARRRRGGRRC